MLARNSAYRSSFVVFSRFSDSKSRFDGFALTLTDSRICLFGESIQQFEEFARLTNKKASVREELDGGYCACELIG
jgi:hypothetical protein